MFLVSCKHVFIPAITFTVYYRSTRTPLRSLTEKNLFTHTQKRRRSIEVTLAFFIFSSTDYNVAKKKRIQHFYGINISSRNVDNVHANDTYVTIEYGSIG